MRRHHTGSLARMSGATALLVALLASLLCDVAAREMPQPKDHDSILPDPRDHELIGWGGEKPRPTVTKRSFAASTKKSMTIEFVRYGSPIVAACMRQKHVRHGRGTWRLCGVTNSIVPGWKQLTSDFFPLRMCARLNPTHRVAAGRTRTCACLSAHADASTFRAVALPTTESRRPSGSWCLVSLTRRPPRPRSAVHPETRIIHVHNFLTEEECDHVIDLVKARLFRSSVVDSGGGGSKIDEIRTVRAPSLARPCATRHVMPLSSATQAPSARRELTRYHSSPHRSAACRR